jgi:IclR family transcriptional regulator, pca regulon regulatory protein
MTNWPESSIPEPRYSESVKRGLAILASFTADRPLMGIADLADHLATSRSTAHRYATTLVEIGYLEQDSSRKYHLSASAADVGFAVLNTMPLRHLSRPLLEKLRLDTNYTVTLGIPAADRVLCLDTLRGSRRGQHAVDLDLTVGSNLPAHCTAIGKVLLAYLPEDEQKAFLDHVELAKQGPNTIISKKTLHAELDSIRRRGLASNDEESARDAQAIAAAIHTADDRIAGAIGLLGSRSATNVDELRAAHGQALLDTAHQISALLHSADVTNHR